MEIGAKIKELRLKNKLTQTELADRCELSKGYISQLENDLTSPSVTALFDVLNALGTTPGDFFSSHENEKYVFTAEDYFEKIGDGHKITWLVPSAQKNMAEPIIIEIESGKNSGKDLPHEGEEFGYVLDGTIKLTVGKRSFAVKKGESFYYRADKPHMLENVGKMGAKILWLSCPPNF